MTMKTSLRIERINAAVAHEIRQYLASNIEDKRLKQAQITSAVVSKDLSYAKIYFSVGEGTIDVKQLTQQLNHAANLFRYHIAQVLDLRVTPEIKFYFDEQAIKTARLLDLI